MLNFQEKIKEDVRQSSVPAQLSNPEIENACAYLKEVERKNEAIDLTDDSPKKLAQKKQSRAIKTQSNRVSF